MSFLYSLLETLAASTVAVAVLWLLFKHWISARIAESIKHEYACELEKLKADLQRENNQQVEEQRATLQLANAKAIELLKSDLSVQVTMDLEQFKSDLQRKTAKEMETFKLGIQQTSVQLQKLEDERNETDRRLFGSILELLPSQGRSFQLVRYRPLSAPFQFSDLDDFDKYLTTTETPEWEFLNGPLEKKRQELSEAVFEFVNFMNMNAFMIDLIPNVYAIQPDDKIKNHDKWENTVAEATQLGRAAADTYDDFLRTCRHYLGC